MSSKPSNMKLYNKIKARVYKRIPKHSAYRSGVLVKEYKAEGGKYTGKKDSSKGLSRWFKEKWETQDGKKEYSKKGDIFRPTKRVTKDTPTTMSELTAKEKRDAMKEKSKTGRVKKYKK